MKEKRCYICKKYVPTTLFRGDKSRADGLQNRCMVCDDIRVNTLRKETGYYRTDKFRTEAKEKGRYTYSYRRKNLLTYYARHRDRILARAKVSAAVRKGTLKRRPCEECGAEKVHAHHHMGYENALLVQWLCHEHHRKAHHEK